MFSPLSSITVSGAYGRQYATKKVALADWEAGKDFRVQGAGPYLSIRDTDLLKKAGKTKLVFLLEKGKQFTLSL